MLLIWLNLRSSAAPELSSLFCSGRNKAGIAGHKNQNQPEVQCNTRASERMLPIVRLQSQTQNKVQVEEEEAENAIMEGSDWLQ